MPVLPTLPPCGLSSEHQDEAGRKDDPHGSLGGLRNRWSPHRSLLVVTRADLGRELAGPGQLGPGRGSLVNVIRRSIPCPASRLGPHPNPSLSPFQLAPGTRPQTPTKGLGNWPPVSLLLAEAAAPIGPRRQEEPQSQVQDSWRGQVLEGEQGREGPGEVSAAPRRTERLRGQRGTASRRLQRPR